MSTIRHDRTLDERVERLEEMMRLSRIHRAEGGIEILALGDYLNDRWFGDVSYGENTYLNSDGVPESFIVKLPSGLCTCYGNIIWNPGKTPADITAGLTADQTFHNLAYQGKYIIAPGSANVVGVTAPTVSHGDSPSGLPLPLEFCPPVSTSLFVPFDWANSDDGTTISGTNHELDYRGKFCQVFFDVWQEGRASLSVERGGRWFIATNFGPFPRLLDNTGATFQGVPGDGDHYLQLDGLSWWAGDARDYLSD